MNIQTFHLKNNHLIVLLIFLLTLTGCNENLQLNLIGEIEFDLERSLIETNSESKKLLIYFNSFGCSGCRTMEERLLINAEIIEMINGNYKLIVLYTDDRKEIVNEKGIESFAGKTIQRNGELNSYYQIKLTRSGSQPKFAIVEDQNFTEMTLDYTLNKDEFMNFLNDNK